MGDTVVAVEGCNSAAQGNEYVITLDPKDADNPLSIGSRSNDMCHCTNQWKLIRKAGNSISNMTLREKFALAFKGEPEKSFIKAGVMNSDESLTSDGQSLFLAFLLKKHGADFKKEVIDPILAEEEAKKA